MAFRNRSVRNRSVRNRSTTGTYEAAPAVEYARPTGTALAGTAAVLVGAWAAVCVYVGPYFGFRPTTHGTWAWTLDNGLLHLLPGAVAVVAGLVLMAFGPARRRVSGGAFTVPALALMAAGAWLVVGPPAWPTFESGAVFATGVSATRNLLDVACSSLAPGLVLAMLGGMAWKAATVRPVAIGGPTPSGGPMMPSEAVPVGAAPVAEEVRPGAGTTV